MRDILKTILMKTTGTGRKASLPTEIAERELQIATCALLLETAHADDEFSPDEERLIESLMKNYFNLSEETVQELKIAAEQKRKDSIDLWGFTKTIKEQYSQEEREKVIEMLWQVIYTDETLNEHEDYLAHKISLLLGLDHKQLINAKIKVLRQAAR
jgi:uncharacterized tellurite resistance protein B-like protein